jgi:hypothetical protein
LHDVENVMKRPILIASLALAGGLMAQAADAMPVHHAHVSGCIARQRADIAPLDRYGGYLPSFAPAMMQQMMNPVFDRMRTQCMPAYHGDGDTGWDTNSPTIASPQ